MECLADLMPLSRKSLWLKLTHKLEKPGLIGEFALKACSQRVARFIDFRFVFIFSFSRADFVCVRFVFVHDLFFFLSFISTKLYLMLFEYWNAFMPIPFIYNTHSLTIFALYGHACVRARSFDSRASLGIKVWFFHWTTAERKKNPTNFLGPYSIRWQTLLSLYLAARYGKKREEIQKCTHTQIRANRICKRMNSITRILFAIWWSNIFSYSCCALLRFFMCSDDDKIQ